MSRSNAGPRTRNTFLCLIQGLPRDFTWKKLKDLARSKVHHGLWADFQMHPSRNEVGCVRAHGREDMLNLYHFLTSQPFDGRRLGVTLFDISDPHAEPVRLCSHNCDQNAHKSNVMARNLVQMPQEYYWQPFIPMMVAVPIDPQLSPQLYSTCAVSVPHGYNTGHLHGGYLNDYAIEHPLAHGFISSSAGTLVNVSNGCTLTEHRGVFVSNLDPRIDRETLHTHFGRVGRITACEVHRGGKSKGNSATVQYASVEEMRRAVDTLDGGGLMGRRIAVRVDTKTPTPADDKASGRKEYLGESMVVDGSGRSSKHRRDSGVAMRRE